MSEKDFQRSIAMTKDETCELKDIQEEDISDEGEEKKPVHMFWRVLKFVMSTTGLLVLSFAYIVAGGYIFRHLEQYNELVDCKVAAADYYNAENASLTLMMDIAVDITGGALQASEDGSELVEGRYQQVMQAFALSVLEAGHNVSKNCSQLGQDGGPQYSWSIIGSITFCLTIVTTIGYGNIAPKTSWGRLVCIAYAIIGIPIVLLCLANIGELMADIFRFVYATVCCCGCCRGRKKKKAAIVPVDPNAWRTDASGKPIKPGSADGAIEELDEDEEEEEDDEEITVPLTITVLVIAGFIVFGAVLFSVWENWAFIDAAYFCFITFTTIGFGDMVPGITNLDSADSKMQLMVTGLYQVIGIAVISMCFQLMQDEIIAKFHWIGQKLGIGVKKEDKKVEDEKESEVVEPEPAKTTAKKTNKLTMGAPTMGQPGSQLSMKTTKTPPV